MAHPYTTSKNKECACQTPVVRYTAYNKSTFINIIGNNNNYNNRFIFIIYSQRKSLTHLLRYYCEVVLSIICVCIHSIRVENLLVQILIAIVNINFEECISARAANYLNHKLTCSILRLSTRNRGQDAFTGRHATSFTYRIKNEEWACRLCLVSLLPAAGISAYIFRKSQFMDASLA